MKRLDCRPYPMAVTLCRDWVEFQRLYRREFKKEWDRRRGKGVTVGWGDKAGGRQYLVYAPRERNCSTLAHELSHAILEVFHGIGVPAHEANGEPFCYLLSSLLEQAV